MARLGQARGEARGEVRGEVRAMLTVLAARDIAVPDEIHQRIVACADLDQLGTWVRRAATATDVGELFGD